MGLQDYFKAQKNNLERACRFELFDVLFTLIDQLYSKSVALVPTNTSPVFGQFLLFWHKSFLAAASLIGQAQPDDASPITRRAIEAARVAVAIKDDPKIAEKWIAFHQRMMARTYVGSRT